MKRRKTNPNTDKDAAKKYVDSQLKVMRKDGTQLSEREYRTLIDRIRQATVS